MRILILLLFPLFSFSQLSIGILESSRIKKLLLDSFPSTASALSLRKISATYNGNCIKVRRSSDNVEQNIGFANNILDTTSLKTFIGINDAFVTTWYDQSSMGNNAIQTTAANQPKIIVSGAINYDNNKPSILFSGNSFLNTNTFLNGNSILNLFTVCNFKTANAYEMLFTTTDATSTNIWFELRRQASYDNIEIYGAYTTASALVNYGTTINAIKLLSILRNGTSFISYTNNALGTNNNVLASNYNSTQSIIGARYDGFYFNGNISEIIFYINNNSSNRVTIQNNINSFYNIY